MAERKPGLMSTKRRALPPGIVGPGWLIPYDLVERDDGEASIVVAGDYASDGWWGHESSSASRDNGQNSAKAPARAAPPV